MSKQQPQVLIAGGGPVGLTLAIDLAQRGIRCVLIESKAEALFLPKMERCNGRSMEIYRRLGLADLIRDASSPTDASMDIGIVTDFASDLVLRLDYPTVDEGRAAVAETRDGSLPLEPYQVISQYTLEPLLRRQVEALGNVEVLYGHDLLDVAQDDDGVTATVSDAGGQTISIRSDYLVGCDGGRSVTRKSLGFSLQGDGSIAERNQIFFRSPDLFDKHAAEPCRMYFFMNDDRTVLTVQDDPTYLRINTKFSGTDEENVAFVRDLLGLEVEIELISVNSWKLHLLVAEHFGAGRVFLAGDALRLVIPTGGLGLNTGIGDATDLAWKLAAVLQGWGGPGLLESYEAERRPTALRAVESSRYANQGQRLWQAHLRPDIDPSAPEYAGVQRAVAHVAQLTQRRTHEMVGTELGYIYRGSDIIVEAENEIDLPDVPEVYIPTARPGARLPHMWLDDGRALHDTIERDEFTLLSFTPGADTSRIGEPFAALGVPFTAREIDQADLARVYGAPAVLIRPDLHVAWRGDLDDVDAESLARRVTGNPPATE